MSRQHVNDMKKAVQGYYSQAQQAAERIKKNNETYRKDVAEQENREIRKQLEAARWEAEAAIRTAQEAGRADAARWGKLSGEEVTEDAKLLQMNITPAQFSDLVEKYKGNGTMSAMLSEYGERRNKESAAAGKTGGYDTTAIPTVEKKAGVYDRFAMNARDILARANQEDGIGRGMDSVLLRTTVEQFGEPSEFNAQLFDLIN